MNQEGWYSAGAGIMIGCAVEIKPGQVAQA